MSARRQWLRWKWWIVPAAVAVALGGALVSFKLAVPEYKATCTLYVAPAPNTPPGQSYQAAQVAQLRVASYLGLLKSDRVARGAIDATQADLAVDDLMARIDATAEASSVLINVSVRDSEAQRSADLANSVCVEFQTVVADADGPNSVVDVKLVERANLPVDPDSPNRKRFIAVGGLSGLLIGFGIIGLMDRVRFGQWSRSNNSGDSAEETDDVPS